MTSQTDILIVGGGLNGRALAIALAQTGHQVTLIDAMRQSLRKKPGFDGRGYALALTSQRMLTALGLWQQVAADSQPILDIKVSDGRPGEGASPWFVHFDHHEIEEGPMGYIVEDRFLRNALLSAMQDHPNINLRWAQTVTRLQETPGGITAELATGKTVTARLVIGCDGRHSGIAKQAGIKRTGWDYDQSALVCAVDHERPHQGCAHQFFTPTGPLAILPLPGNRSSIVWTQDSVEAERVNALPDAKYLDCLHPYFGDFLGAISLSGKRFSYPLGLSLAQTTIASRIALVGDAAHGIHPLAGQGLNLGLRDIAALTEVLAQAKRRGEDIGKLSVLSAYQSWRRFDTAALAVATDGINRLFSNDNAVLRSVRDIGLGAVNALPGLRRGLMRQAAGLTGDLPRLLQGKQV